MYMMKQEPLLAQFQLTRKRTLDITSTLERDDYTVQTAAYTSPPKWHLGHVSWIYEVVMSKIEDYTFYSDEFSQYLNSYYRQFGSPGEKGRRGDASRPTLDEILAYHAAVDLRVEEFLNAGTDDDRAAMIALGIHHECQHQELLIYDIQHMLSEQYRPFRREHPPEPAHGIDGYARVRGGLYSMGYGGDGFCYDIELPEHTVYLEEYELAVAPVTNKEYMEFMADGGYGDYKYWLSDGWDCVNNEGWNSPMYWENLDGEWWIRDFAGLRRVDPREPVCHVSFYEADAYCRWAGRRLPTEAEWEKAALWDEERRRKYTFPWGNQRPTRGLANLLESYAWRCSAVGSYPDGKSPAGCHQMIGDVWEWTASEFVGYPGYKTGFSEYNDKWFSGQKVLRGGSFGTPTDSIRGSYRNFFRMNERWMFSGFRCASDA